MDEKSVFKSYVSLKETWQQGVIYGACQGFAKKITQNKYLVVFLHNEVLLLLRAPM